MFMTIITNQAGASLSKERTATARNNNNHVRAGQEYRDPDKV